MNMHRNDKCQFCCVFGSRCTWQLFQKSFAAMGNAYGSWFPIGDAKKEGTTLIELHIQNISDAHDIVGLRPDEAYTPVTLTPHNSRMYCCCCCWTPCVSIPEGFTAIITKFGAVVPGDEEDGTWKPGCHCFPCFYQVDKLVSKQVFVFDTPVRDVKTKDNVTVNIDVLIVFRIEKARDFVYQIGPAKFDDLLRAMQDEALRQMAIETPVEKIYDLHGTDTNHIVHDLNQKVEKYGVKILHFTVKGVRIPDRMAQDFEDRTLYDPQTQMKHMQQASDRLKLNNEEGKVKLKDECENARMAAEQQARVVKVQAEKETASVIAQAKKDIAELEANKEAEQRQVTVNAELEVSKIKAEIVALERDEKAKIQSDVGRLHAHSEAYCKEEEAKAKIKCAEKLANGKRAMGEAEGDASAAFAAQRSFQAQMKRLDVLAQLIQNPEVLIATSQENTVGLNPDNAVVSQVAQQGLEALRAKLAQITTSSLAMIEPGHKK